MKVIMVGKIIKVSSAKNCFLIIYYMITLTDSKQKKILKKKSVFITINIKSLFYKRFQGQSLHFCFIKIILKRFFTNFVIFTLVGRISYKFWKCLAGRIIYSRAGSILSAGRIPFKFKKGLGAGHFTPGAGSGPRAVRCPPLIKGWFKKGI